MFTGLIQETGEIAGIERIARPERWLRHAHHHQGRRVFHPN